MLDFESCEDIDECYVHPEICPDNMYCTNTEGSYKCTCETGYQPDKNGPSCVDINECLEGIGHEKVF